MTSSDKDFRFMATNDLMTELQKDSIKLDDDSERKVFYFKQLVVSQSIKYYGTITIITRAPADGTQYLMIDFLQSRMGYLW